MDDSVCLKRCSLPPEKASLLVEALRLHVLSSLPVYSALFVVEDVIFQFLLQLPAAGRGALLLEL